MKALLPTVGALRSQRFHRLSKEGGWILFGQAAVVTGSLIGVRLLTGLLKPVAYGELALGMTVATLVNQVVLGPLGVGVTRFYAPAKEQNDLQGYLKATGTLALLATGVIACMVCVTISGLLITGRTEWISIASAAFVFSIFSGFNSILNGMQNAARQRSVVAIHQGMVSWLRFLVAGGLVLWLGATSTNAMVGYALAVLIVLGSQYLFFQKRISPTTGGVNHEKDWQAHIWQFTWPISIFGVFTWFQMASDRWALGLFSTTQDVGFYSVLFQLGYYPMSLISGMMLQLLTPIFFQRAGDASNSQRKANVKRRVWHLTLFSTGVSLTAFFTASLFHVQIFRLFVAAEYATISYLLPWMILAGGFFACGQTVSLNLMSQMKTRIMIAPKVITAILGVATNIAGAYWYGVKGIVFANVLFSTLYFTWMAMLSRYE